MKLNKLLSKATTTEAGLFLLKTIVAFKSPTLSLKIRIFVR